MSRRSRAREVALQVLFQDDLNPRNNPAVADDLVRRRLRRPELVEFARILVAGVRGNREALDELIAQTAQNWTLGRIAPTDRNVLRLGAYEILHSDTPDRVAVDEAVNLAKRYGTAQSGKFVNGILDRLMHANQDQ
ncbi:MAG: transcription antitermination factor NusB [Planctomycetes bacterium]|nr:transcription antitermination factor NusB [Planctomycetota bacterium]